MTRKDYELVAHQLWLAQPTEHREKQYWTDLVHNMAMAFQRENANFKADKFIETCENGLKKWK